MKRFLHTICIMMLSALLAIPAAAQWTYYTGYNQLNKAIPCGSSIYGLYSGGSLLSYNTETSEVTFYNKTTGLNDTGILMMDYSKSQRKLVILYENGNIDLLNTVNGKVTNMPQYKLNPDTDMQLLFLWADEGDAFISTKWGIIRLDLTNATIKAYYKIGATVAARTHEGYLYALRSDNTVQRCSLKSNPLDPTCWERTQDKGLPGVQHVYPEADDFMNKNLTAFGPASNYHYKLRHDGTRLTSISGRINAGGVDHHYTGVMFYNGKDWSRISQDFSADPYPLPATNPTQYRNTTDAIHDPADPEHIFVAYSGAGLMEYRGGKMVTRYGIHNSTLKSLIAGDDVYTRACALAFDKEGTLWMVNAGATDFVKQVPDAIMSLDRQGNWKAHHFESLVGVSEVDHMMFDSRGYLWLADKRYAGGRLGGIFCYDPATGANLFRTNMTNQDGTAVSAAEAYCVVEDHKGQIWIGSSAGLLVVEEPEEWFTDDFLITQIKVPRNDGTNFADYLLSGVGISTIRVDGGNRKWIGTKSNGVYLVSADGLETLVHFTADNSLLPSDIIHDIAIDPISGEVFISTDAGLVSYASNATDPLAGLDRNQIEVFPNPLRPENARCITLRGLTEDAEVKIANLSGQIVHSGRSLGGMYQWDSCDQSGTPCASGVYLILISTADGKNAIAGKLAIVR